MIRPKKRTDAIFTRQIEDFQTVVESGLAYELWPFSTNREPINVEHGPLRGVRGALVGTSKEGKVVISIPSIRRSVAAAIDDTPVVLRGKKQSCINVARPRRGVKRLLCGNGTI